MLKDPDEGRSHAQPGAVETMLGDLTGERGRQTLVNELILETHRRTLESTLSLIEQSDCDPIRRDRVWNGLRAAAGAPESTNARLLAIWCFARLQAPEARHRIIGALADDDYHVRGAAAEALKSAITADDLEPLASVVDAAPSEIGSEATSSLAEMVVASGKVQGAEAALEMLARISHPRVSELIARAIDHRNAHVRAAALAQAATLGLSECAPAAARHLADADANVRRAAAALLGTVGDAGVAGTLVQWVLGQPGTSADGTLMRMANRHAQSVSNELVRALRESPPEKRRAAARLLAATHDAAAVPALITALEDSDEAVAAEAARALGQSGNPIALDPLVAAARRAVSRNESTLRGRVSDALKKLGGKAAVDRAFGESAI